MFSVTVYTYWQVKVCVRKSIAKPYHPHFSGFRHMVHAYVFKWKWHFHCCLFHSARSHCVYYHVKEWLRESITKPYHPYIAFFRFQTYGSAYIFKSKLHFLCCLCHIHCVYYQVKMCIRESIAKPHHPHFAFFWFQTYGGICFQTKITFSCCLRRLARSRCVYYQVKEWVRESIGKVSVLNLLLSPLMCHWTVLMCLLHKCPSISKSKQSLQYGTIWY